MADHPRVLVVEDDADAQQVTLHILEYLNMVVDIANDAESAEHLLFTPSSLAYDMVIIDLALPGKDGWQLLNEIQAFRATAHMKCVAMTAFHRNLMRERALQAGFIEYFPKPINSPVFAKLISQLMHNNGTLSGSIN